MVTTGTVTGGGDCTVTPVEGDVGYGAGERTAEECVGEWVATEGCVAEGCVAGGVVVEDRVAEW